MAWFERRNRFPLHCFIQGALIYSVGIIFLVVHCSSLDHRLDSERLMFLYWTYRLSALYWRSHWNFIVCLFWFILGSWLLWKLLFDSLHDNAMYLLRQFVFQYQLIDEAREVIVSSDSQNRVSAAKANIDVDCC